jgi:hypothetical protein
VFTFVQKPSAATADCRNGPIWSNEKQCVVEARSTAQSFTQATIKERLRCKKGRLVARTIDSLVAFCH